MTYIEILSIPSPIPNRLNEDAWLALESAESPGYLIAAVIDGASARLTIPRLETALQQRHHGLTAAAFAAAHVRRSLVSQLNAQPDLSLRTALLAANDALRQTMADYIGGFSSKNILAQVESLSNADDPRRFRLTLPACVVTLIRLDYTYYQLEYVHAGDTSLLEIRRDGEVICHTTDQMERYDYATLSLAARLGQTNKVAHFSEAALLPEVRQLNIEQGLRHNYVDAQGHTHSGEGCGVVNGLPELADYLEYGAVTVNPEQTAGFCLLSDGLHLLAPLDETAAQKMARLRQTGVLLQTQGLPGLFAALQKMIISDMHHDQYPRLKTQDDATGVYVKISGK